MSRRSIIIAVCIGSIVLGLSVAGIMMNLSKKEDVAVTPELVQKTDLTTVSSNKIQQYIDLLRTPIRNVPWYVPKETKAALENQLGIALRAKYGPNTLTATVRGDTQDRNGLRILLLDIAEKNETYYGQYSDTQAENVSISCANQPDQINPETSRCITAPAEDNYVDIFKEG